MDPIFPCQLTSAKFTGESDIEVVGRLGERCSALGGNNGHSIARKVRKHLVREQPGVDLEAVDGRRALGVQQKAGILLSNCAVSGGEVSACSD